MNERLTEELTNILRDTMEPRSGLSQEQLKTLALELAAAMPPVESRPTFQPELTPLVAQIDAVLNSALDALNCLTEGTEPEERRRVTNQVAWLIDAGITITDKLAHETRLR